MQKDKQKHIEELKDQQISELQQKITQLQKQILNLQEEIKLLTREKYYDC